jgi:hypothetical protein
MTSRRVGTGAGGGTTPVARGAGAIRVAPHGSPVARAGSAGAGTGFHIVPSAVPAGVMAKRIED